MSQSIEHPEQSRVVRAFGTRGDAGTVVAIDGDQRMVMWDRDRTGKMRNDTGVAYWHRVASLVSVDDI